MIGLILLIVFTILFWVGVWLADRNDWEGWEYVFGYFGAMVSLGLIASIIVLCSKPSDDDYFIEKRNRHEEIINNIGPGVSTETLVTIYNDAYNDNKKILNHRKHVDSNFSGIYYSHKIAECELIKIPELNSKTE